MHSFALLQNHTFSKNLLEFCQKLRILNFFKKMQNFAKFSDVFAKFLTKNEIAELCKGVHCVDLGESFQTHI